MYKRRTALQYGGINCGIAPGDTTLLTDVIDGLARVYRGER